MCGACRSCGGWCVLQCVCTCAGERNMATTQKPPFWQQVAMNSLAVGAFLAAWAHHDWDPWMPVVAVRRVLLLYVCVGCFTFFGSMFVSLGAIGFLPWQPNYKYLFPRAER